MAKAAYGLLKELFAFGSACSIFYVLGSCEHCSRDAHLCQTCELRSLVSMILSRIDVEPLQAC
jgi:hypothetical protein